MIDKITKKYKYANKIVIIFGFKNIMDYSSVLSYSDLKKNTSQICNAINETMDEFKKLFNLKKFDLARINYCFSTITQIYSFLKKLLTELSIPFESFKKKQQTYMRLIQNNILYINNIMNMTDNGTTTNFQSEKLEKIKETLKEEGQELLKNTTSQAIQAVKEIKLTEIIKTYGKKPKTKEFLFVDYISLFYLRDYFDCITELDIKLFSQNDYPETYNVDMRLKISHLPLPLTDTTVSIYKKTINKNENCLINNTLLPIHTTNINSFILNCEYNSNAKFLVKITGIKFKSILPKTIFENKIHIDILNKTEKELENLNLYSLWGVLSFENDNSKLQPPNITMITKNHDEEQELQTYKNNNKITERIVNLCNENVLIIKIDNEIIINNENNDEINKNNDEIFETQSNVLRYFVFLSTNIDRLINLGFGTDIKSKKIDKENFGLEYNFKNKLKNNFSIINNNNITMYYRLNKIGDLIDKIKILNKFTNIYNIKITINYDNINICEKHFFTNEILNFEFEKPIPTINKHFKDFFLTVEIPIQYFDEWKVIDLISSNIYLDMKMRLLLVNSQ
jgi:hypothetical protein